MWDLAPRISLRNLLVGYLIALGELDRFNANNHWTLLPLRLSVSAASLCLLYVLALTCLFVVCCLGWTSGSNSWISELWIRFDNGVYVKYGVTDQVRM